MKTLLDQLPCATLITDEEGHLLSANSELQRLLGMTGDEFVPTRTMDELFPPAGRIFLQTHVWPTLRREGSASELSLSLKTKRRGRIPVLMNCRRGQFEGAVCYFWVFFVAVERSRFEQALLSARARSDESAVVAAKATHFIKTITDAMPGLVAYWDRDLRCRFANRPYLTWFGREPERVLGLSMRELLGDALFTANEPYARKALEGEPQQFQRTVVNADGSTAHTLAHYIPDAIEGSIQGFFVMVSDVTALKRTEVELQLAASVFHDTLDGILISDVNGVILSVNPAFTRITGYSAHEAIGQRLGILGSARNDQRHLAEMARALVANRHWEGESWGRRKDGGAFRQWQRVTTTTSDGIIRYAFVFNDVTERWQNQERAKHLALHDALTDLPNRALLMERLGQLINLTRRETRNLAVLFLDLDRFKQVNDTLGHDVGDDLLRLVARRLQALVRQTDTVARLGGDEFVILLDNPANLQEVHAVAGRLVQSINTPMEFDGKRANVGTSIGIAMYPVDGRTAAELLKSADAAMYEAKAAGKNTYRSSSASLVRPS
ncbi:MAG: diguanylate cyclase [Myxococcales bacterium]|nr:diguanylate cyclase [Myxococcales bacterium]MDP3506251.1 diguanylate cyclase [Myxococcales bacterium]